MLTTRFTRLIGCNVPIQQPRVPTRKVRPDAYLRPPANRGVRIPLLSEYVPPIRHNCH